MTNLFHLALAAGLAAGLASCGGGEASQSDQAADEAPKILLFSHSTGWRHDSIETGVEALKALGEQHGYAVTASEDPGIFNAAVLDDTDVVILLNTTSKSEDGGEWFTGERRDAFQNYVRNGGGVVAIHGASDSHYNWPWYGRMIGGYFERHPQGTPHGRLKVTYADAPSTRGLPASFERVDEWYWIKDFNPEVHVLVTLDPQSIDEADINPKPISWRHEYDGGRVFYTSMGHTKETYAEPLFLDHIAGGVDWAAGRAE